MNTLAWIGLAVGCLIVFVAIASVVVATRYRPTVEVADVGCSGRPESMTGWRRVVALVVGAPVFTVFLLLRAAGLFRERQ
jgi:hypothetical protein